MSESKYFIADNVILDGKICQDLWEIKQKYITNGGYGRILNACCKDDCGYIAKVIDIEGKYNVNDMHSELENEIKNQQKASNIGLAPKIVFAGIIKSKNKYTAYLIMKRMKYTLQEQIDKEPEKYINFVESILNMILKLHQELICHDDIHSLNIMIDQEDNLQFIDFGESGELKSFNSAEKSVWDFKWRYKDYSSLINTFKQWKVDITPQVIEFILKNENPFTLYTPQILEDDMLSKNSILKIVKNKN